MPWSSLLDALRFVAGGVCHQLPERSLRIGGTMLPLCARCTGTYLGACLGLLTVLLRRRLRASLLPPWPALAAFAVFFLAWGIDGLNSYLTLFPGAPHLYEPRNALRVLTGMLQGLALSLTIWPVVGFTLWRHPEPQHVINLRELAILVAAAGLMVLIIMQPLPVVLIGASALSGLGLFGMFGTLNTLLIIVLLRRENTADHGLAAARLFALGLVAGGLELVILGTLRRWLLGF